MSVVPLVMDTPGRTVVDNYADFTVGGHCILILYLDKAQLEIAPKNLDSNVSYDLRVGSQYRDYREKGMKPLSKGEDILIQPGSAVIIRTMEQLHLPTSMYGIVTPRVTLL
jgi:deoxycytidine triphosphate deaminase